MKSATFAPQRFSGKALLWAAALGLLLAVAAWFGMHALSQDVDRRQLALMESGIRRCAVQCYALEGFYPPNLDYLQQEYGLALDRTRFIYHYEWIGSNMLPSIAVFPGA